MKQCCACTALHSRHMSNVALSGKQLLVWSSKHAHIQCYTQADIITRNGADMRISAALGGMSMLGMLSIFVKVTRATAVAAYHMHTFQAAAVSAGRGEVVERMVPHSRCWSSGSSFFRRCICPGCQPSPAGQQIS